ncbi:hypothetical protein NIES4071_44110 [Calothrix sp. NIES-4071]|nr:hypothetical protein NIES4071_44110 [Calothrix sp. NIES-4071]BAZ58725.1 hypothetical protein NIES4105_44040 [Calothrix sp. NIES-4105]
MGINAFSYGIDIEETDVKYKADLNLLNVSTLVDYHPFKNSGLRLTGGVVFNNNKVEGNAQARNNQEFEFNGNTYNTSQIGSAKAKVSLPNSVAPYLGIGWGNAVRPGNRLSFAVNLGVMFTGSPNVDVTGNIDPSVPAATREQILRDVKAEERQLEKDLDGYSIYPVLSVGVSYHF